MKFYRNEEIEELAERRLGELEKALGQPLSLPISIDLVAEKVLELDFSWEPIDELPGEQILGGLVPPKRLIILNDKHLALFQEKPGLERSTKGHEMGHWDLFTDKTMLDQPTLFKPSDDPAFSYRTSPAGEVEILKKLWSRPECAELARKIMARADDADERRAVNRYAAALSMPARIVSEEARKTDRTVWGNLYKLCEKFGVTISALTVRLEQLGLLYVAPDKRLFESKDAALGQTTFDF